MAIETLTIDPGASPLQLADGTDGFVVRSISTPSPPRKRVEATSIDTEGSIPVESQYDNRTLTVVVRALAPASRAVWYTRLQKLQMKLAKINSEGGVLKRILIGGVTTLYYDLVDAAGDMDWDSVRYALQMDSDVTLSFLARPFERGDEITTLANHIETTLPALIFTEPLIKGDVPALGRLVVDNDVAFPQLSMLWALQSRYYSVAATAALFYECEALTPVYGAVYALAGLSGGSSIRMLNLPQGQWCPVMSTDHATLGKLTHKGSYRVLVTGTFTGTAGPIALQYMYNLGDTSQSHSLGEVTVPVSGVRCTVDLGVLRLGNSAQHQGIILALGAGTTDSVIFDTIMFIPVDECVGQADALQQDSPLTIATSAMLPTVGTDSGANGGALAWNLPMGICDFGGIVAQVNAPVLNAGQVYTTHRLISSGHGFSVNPAATIVGIKVTMARWNNTARQTTDAHVQLLKAGVVQAGDKPTPDYWEAYPAQVVEYGGSNDLWGTTWTPADINNAGFGAGLVVTVGGMDHYSAGFGVDYIRITVYYTLTALAPTPDAVIFASKSMQIADTGVTRQNSAGTVWSPESLYEGDLLRIPPSGMEARPVRFIVKVGRQLMKNGDPNMDDISAKLFYTPRWLQHPDT